MHRSKRAGRRTTWSLAAVAALGAALVVPGSGAAQAQEGAELPNTFGLRLEGFAIEVNTYSTATAITPRSAYSYAKVSSSLDLDGGRGLDMEARGANSQYAGLEGAVIFSGDTPTDGNNLPGYTQAFFPAFEGFSEVSEKCALNQNEAREAPECRDQEGPYALSRVVPDQAAPSAIGIGRNQGGGEAGGDARSESVVEPQADGSIQGVQRNLGSDQRVPGTPITVDSYVAEQTVTARRGESSVEIRCAGEVSVAGQQVSDNRALQELLAPLTIGSDLRVTFEPASEPEVSELPGGALEAECRGPRFTVFSSGQGGSGTTYTFGSTFAAVGLTEDREPFSGGGAGAIGDFPDLPGGGGGEVPPPATGSPGTASSPPPAPSTPPAGDEAPTTTVPIASDDGETAIGPDLVRRSVDTLPIGAFTAAGGALLALGVWLLLGVTGSLARGLPSLRLPPFHD